MSVSVPRLIYAESAPRYFLVVTSLLYLGVFATSSLFAGANLCRMPGDASGPFIFAAGIALLLGLEQLSYRRYGFYMPLSSAVALIIVRMILFELIAAVDCSGLSRTLYPLVPFMAFFTLGRRASYGLSVFYILFFLVKLSLFVPDWYLSQTFISDVLMLVIGFGFALSIAHIAYDAEVNRRRAETFLADLRRSHRRLEIYAEQVAELAASEERNRLARDIHDSLGHYLTTINILIEKALAFRTRNGEESEQALMDARKITREALQDIRRSVSALRAAGDKPSLRGLLRDLVTLLEPEMLSVQLNIEGDESDIPYPLLMCLYRVTQEALTNIRKHADAKHVCITVRLSPARVTIEIQDDGRGFELPSSPLNHQTHGLGLLGIRERIDLMGGTLDIKTSPQRGTFIQASIPRTHDKASLFRYPLSDNMPG